MAPTNSASSRMACSRAESEGASPFDPLPQSSAKPRELFLQNDVQIAAMMACDRDEDPNNMIAGLLLEPGDLGVISCGMEKGT